MIRPLAAVRHRGHQDPASGGINLALFQVSNVRKERIMSPQRAILVPGHGVPETIRRVRFHRNAAREEAAVGALDSESGSLPSTVELWAGNYYGDPEGLMLASRAATGEIEFVFSENEPPVIPPERSLTAIIRDPPPCWVMEIESEFKTTDGTDVTRRMCIDNFGTARESLGEQTANRSPTLIGNRAA
jgi:hypothetical protein